MTPSDEENEDLSNSSFHSSLSNQSATSGKRSLVHCSPQSVCSAAADGNWKKRARRDSNSSSVCSEKEDDEEDDECCTATDLSVNPQVGKSNGGQLTDLASLSSPEPGSGSRSGSVSSSSSSCKSSNSTDHCSPRHSSPSPSAKSDDQLSKSAEVSAVVPSPERLSSPPPSDSSSSSSSK